MALGLVVVEASTLVSLSLLVTLFTFGAHSSAVLVQGLAGSLCCIAAFYYLDLYDLRVVRTLAEFMGRLLKAIGIAMILTGIFCSAVSAAGFETDVSGGSIVLPVIAGALVVPIRALSYTVLARRSFAQRVLILGTGPLAARIADEIEAAPGLGYRLIGLVDDSETGKFPQGQARRTLGRIEQVEELIDTVKPEAVVIALTERRGRLPMWRLLSHCAAGVRVHEAVSFYESISHKIAIESLTPSGLVFSKAFRKPRLEMALRRALSVAGAAIGLVLSAPIMAIVAALIKLDSPGPVFFVQERAGLGGRIFRLVKFRTMRLGDPSQGGVFARDDGGRVTRLGKWLRKLRLDELPQFLNVLTGDMDLVGPRPEMAGNISAMVERIPYYPMRHVVRPGITGWAQVRQGYSVSEEEVTEKMRYDLYYVKHMSLALDLRILLDTFKIVLVGRGAR